jgi:hypothetical protein
MKKEQTVSNKKLSLDRRVVAKLNRTDAGGAHGYTTFITTILATFSQRCCGSEDSSKVQPSFCGGSGSAVV